MRKKVWLFALAAVLLVILAGCRGNKLPDGMDEDKVSSAGLAVMSQLDSFQAGCTERIGG